MSHGPCAGSLERLSILDLSGLGRQPMVSDDGDLVMVFNGEIYNFAEIRSDPGACAPRGSWIPEWSSAHSATSRRGGPRRDRLDVQKVWLLLAFEMRREKWA